MRIVALICLVGVGCQNNSGSSSTSDNGNSKERGKATFDDRPPESKVEAPDPKNDISKELQPEKRKAQIEQAMLECSVWEKAIKVYKLANNGVQPAQLKDVANYVQDGKKKLLSPWGTPYVMESDPKDLLSDDIRVTATTDDHQLVTKKGVEKTSTPKP